MSKLNDALRRRLDSSKGLDVRYLSMASNTIHCFVLSSKGDNTGYLVDVAFNGDGELIGGSCLCPDYAGFVNTLKHMEHLPTPLQMTMLSKMPFLRKVLCCKHILAAASFCVEHGYVKKAGRAYTEKYAQATNAAQISA